MSELSYVQVGRGSWSIARFIVEGLEWWCGERDGWVSPFSGWWGVNPDCWNATFKTLPEARRFARSKGWEQS